MSSSALVPVSLDANWQVEYFEVNPDLYEWAAAAQPVPSLSKWHCTARFDEAWAAMLHTRFDLLPLDICVHYLLHIERAPGSIILYINGRRMGEIDGGVPFCFDVTDYVTLEDNQMSIKVMCADAGTFGRVYLLPVACEP